MSPEMGIPARIAGGGVMGVHRTEERQSTNSTNSRGFSLVGGAPSSSVHWNSKFVKHVFPHVILCMSITKSHALVLAMLLAMLCV